jgi:hypothetical protein
MTSKMAKMMQRLGRTGPEREVSDEVEIKGEKLELKGDVAALLVHPPSARHNGPLGEVGLVVPVVAEDQPIAAHVLFLVAVAERATTEPEFAVEMLEWLKARVARDTAH